MATERRRRGQRLRGVKIECVESVGIGTEENEHKSAQLKEKKNVIQLDGGHILFDEDRLFRYKAKCLLRDPNLQG
jgi:hypothetical protein